MKKFEATLKKQDAWIAVYFYDIIAIWIMHALARFLPAIRPNDITFINLILGLCAIVSVFMNSFLVAAIFLQIGCLLDCVDGKWARHTQRFSPYGERFDAFADFLTHTILSFIIAAKVWSDHPVVAACLVVIGLGAAYIHVRTLMSVHKEGNAHLSPFSHAGWFEACRKRRLLARPLSEIEVTFVLPSLFLIALHFNAGAFIPVILLAIYLFFRVVSKPINA